jgi:hypothetical protein
MLSTETAACTRRIDDCYQHLGHRGDFWPEFGRDDGRVQSEGAGRYLLGSKALSLTILLGWPIASATDKTMSNRASLNRNLNSSYTDQMAQKRSQISKSSFPHNNVHHRFPKSRLSAGCRSCCQKIEREMHWHRRDFNLRTDQHFIEQANRSKS